MDQYVCQQEVQRYPIVRNAWRVRRRWTSWTTGSATSSSSSCPSPSPSFPHSTSTSSSSGALIIIFHHHRWTHVLTRFFRQKGTHSEISPMFIVLSTSFSLLLAFTRGSTVSMVGVGLESDVVSRLHQTFILLLTAHWVEWGAHTHKDRVSKLGKVQFSTLWMENTPDQLSVVSSAIYIVANQSIPFFGGIFWEVPNISLCGVQSITTECPAQHFYSPYETTQLEKTIKKQATWFFSSSLSIFGAYLGS